MKILNYIPKFDLENRFKEADKKYQLNKKINNRCKFIFLLSVALGLMQLFIFHTYPFLFLCSMGSVFFGVRAETNQTHFENEKNQYNELTTEPEMLELKSLLDRYPVLQEYKNQLIQENRKWTQYDLKHLINYCDNLEKENKLNNLDVLKNSLYQQDENIYQHSKKLSL